MYAEFRQDWATALQFYRAAYTAATELPPTPVRACCAACPPAHSRGLTAPPRCALLCTQVTEPRRWQRWHERAAVAEWCHFKIITLLLHTGGPADAVAQLHRHMAKHRRPPPGLPPVLLPAHWGYAMRQFSVFGELLQARLPAGDASSLPQAPEAPGTYFAAAANAGIRRRQAWAALGETHDGALPSPPPVAAGTYVGQFRREPSGPPLSDDEFAAHLAAAEKPTDYIKGNLELLSRAHTLLKHTSANATGCGRVLSSILSQMANEYLCAGDCASALRLLRSVAAVHRQDGWNTLLAGTLSSLRECAGRLSMHDEHAAWSLELGSLHADDGESLPERTAVLSAALAAMCARDEAEAQSASHVTLTEVRCARRSRARARALDALRAFALARRAGMHHVRGRLLARLCAGWGCASVPRCAPVTHVRAATAARSHAGVARRGGGLHGGPAARNRGQQWRTGGARVDRVFLLRAGAGGGRRARGGGAAAGGCARDAAVPARGGSCASGCGPARAGGPPHRRHRARRAPRGHCWPAVGVQHGGGAERDAGHLVRRACARGPGVPH